jgi:hypothetical protein
MATTVKLMDSADHFTTRAQALMKWTDVDSANMVVVAGAGRNGTAGWRFGNGSNFLKKVATSEQFHYAAFGFKPQALPTGDVPLISFRDGATEQCDLRLTTAGKFIVTRNGTTIAGPGTFIITIGVYFYIEFRVKIDDATGTVDVWVNGGAGTDVTGSGLDTKNGANATADTVLFCGRVVGGFGPNDSDDFVWVSGSTAVTRWGDTRMEYIKPNGNGNSSQWVGSDGNSVDNYLLVDETTPNDDTDYVASSTVGDIDLYTFTDVTPTTGAVKAVAVYLYARKDDAGTRTIAVATRESATNSFGGNQDLSTQYNYYREIFELNPRTAAAYTIGEVNGSEFGIKEIA